MSTNKKLVEEEYVALNRAIQVQKQLKEEKDQHARSQK